MQALIGPPQAECFQNQRYRMYRDNHLVLETSQTMPNIPFGDHFTVEVRWDVTQLPGASSQCRVQSCVSIPFSKATWWKKVSRPISGSYQCCVGLSWFHICSAGGSLTNSLCARLVMDWVVTKEVRGGCLNSLDAYGGKCSPPPSYT